MGLFVRAHRPTFTHETAACTLADNIENYLLYRNHRRITNALLIMFGTVNSSTYEQNTLFATKRDIILFILNAAKWHKANIMYMEQDNAERKTIKMLLTPVAAKYRN